MVTVIATLLSAGAAGAGAETFVESVGGRVFDQTLTLTALLGLGAIGVWCARWVGDRMTDKVVRRLADTVVASSRIRAVTDPFPRAPRR